MTASDSVPGVLLLQEIDADALEAWFASHGLRVVWHPVGAPIPGSFWGEPEAGLIADALHVRPDTPVQSALHEGCHWVCLPPARREHVHTNVGGSALEECATCYLQITVAAQLEGVGQARMLADMDRWGYSFRLGSARAWFESDAEDARAWLRERALLSAENVPATGPCEAVRGARGRRAR
ncbi:MAG: hypothetical protein AAGA11_12875 [Pseudomonadota bacterium]